MKKDNILKILVEIIDLLNQTDWLQQAEWYKQKLKLLKETNEKSSEFNHVLKDIDSSISGMGSFSDLPMKKEFSDIQWELSVKLSDAIQAFNNTID